VTRAIAVALLLIPALPAESQRYSIRPNESNRLELRVAKAGIYRGKVHVFLFPQYSGSLVYDSQKPEASQVNVTISARDIKLTDTWLSEKDFKSVQEYALKDMLAAEKYPDIAFISAAVRAIDPTHFEVRGTLTIRGLAKPSVLNVTLEAPAKAALRLRGDAIIRLTDYELKPPKAALGLIGTENEMKFSFSLAPTSATE
jgi:polyisoprenoid-binding protein YceI